MKFELSGKDLTEYRIRGDMIFAFLDVCMGNLDKKILREKIDEFYFFVSYVIDNNKTIKKLLYNVIQ